jgi:hypothetical protein
VARVKYVLFHKGIDVRPALSTRKRLPSQQSYLRSQNLTFFPPSRLDEDNGGGRSYMAFDSMARISRF